MAEPKKKGSRGTMVFVIVLLLLTLIGAGSGLAVGLLLQRDAPETSAATEAPATTAEAAAPEAKAAEHSPPEGEQTAEAAPAPEAAEEVVDLHSLKIIPFPPVLTTLAEPKGKWIRVEGSILSRRDSDVPPEIQAEKAGEQILAYLRSVRLDQLEGPSGLLGLRDDLNETVRALSNGEVREVIIHGLIVE